MPINYSGESVRLFSICLHCCSGDKAYWYHEKSECTSNNGWIYLRDDAYLECDECHRSGLITSWLFKCHSNNHNEYEGIDVMEITTVLGALGGSGITSSGKKKLGKILLDRL